MDSKEKQFVSDCRWLAETLGIEKIAYVVSSSVEGAHLRYEDNVVVVEAGLKNLSLTITGKGESEGGVLPVTNPVIYLDEQGKSYRYHGEARRLFDHVRAVVKQGI